MNKKWIKSTLILLFAMSLVLAGCGKGESSNSNSSDNSSNSASKSTQSAPKKLKPAEAAEKAMKKMMEMKSYGFETAIKFNDLEFPPSVLQDPSAAMGLEFLKNAKLTFSGKAQMQPMQLEMDIDAAIQNSDTSMNFKIPMMMNEEKVYFKLPTVLQSDLGLPAEMASKYMEMDLNELAGLEGQSMQMPTAKEIEKLNKLYGELYVALASEFDEKTFFSDVKVKDANLPEGIKASQVVKFSITDENVDEAVKTLAKESLPALMDVVLDNKELSQYMTPADRQEMDKIKADLKSITDKEIEEGLAEMKKVLKINELSFTTAIDKDGFPVYTSFVINITLSHAGETMKIGAQMDSTFTDINKKQKFKPAPTDTINMNDMATGQF